MKFDIAAMATALRHPETWNGSESDYAEGLDLAADMLDHQAAEITTLRAERDAALDQRDMWMNRAMNELGENLALKGGA